MMLRMADENVATRTNAIKAMEHLHFTYSKPNLCAPSSRADTQWQRMRFVVQLPSSCMPSLRNFSQKISVFPLILLPMALCDPDPNVSLLSRRVHLLIFFSSRAREFTDHDISYFVGPDCSQNTTIGEDAEKHMDEEGVERMMADRHHLWSSSPTSANCVSHCGILKIYHHRLARN